MATCKPACIPGFNGAAVVRPRRAGAVTVGAFTDGMLQRGRGRETAESQMVATLPVSDASLQRGRGRETAESLRRSRRRGRVGRSFNGAAVVRPRRAGGTFSSRST